MKALLKRIGQNYICNIVFVIGSVFLLRTFFYGLYCVPSESMEKTMLVGEFFFADKFSFLWNVPLHNDVIAFNDPLFKYSNNRFIAFMQRNIWGPDNWTKRIIGVPGDEIKGCVENGKAAVYRNGKKVFEEYIQEHPLQKIESTQSTVSENFWNGSDFFSIKLKSNQYWVMGDNRSNSCDSRSFGPLERNLIHAKIRYR
jgi:signal peptidase I